MVGFHPFIMDYIEANRKEELQSISYTYEISMELRGNYELELDQVEIYDLEDDTRVVL